MRLLIATIGKPFGVRGEVTLRLRTDEPKLRLAAGETLAVDEDGQRTLQVESFRLDPPGGILKLSGILNRQQAEELRGHELWAEVESDRTAADDEEWYDHELVGLPCYSPTGDPLGEVVEIAHHPAHDSLVVRTGSGNRFVPFVSAIVTEVTSECVVIAAPEGLLSDHEDEGMDPKNGSHAGNRPNGNGPKGV